MLSNTEIIEKIRDMVVPVLEDERLDLIELELKPAGKRWLLRVYIDKAGGVTIGDCEYVSRELSRHLDVDDVIEHPYTLEVSSPGLTRQLKKSDDFSRYPGRTCRVVTREKIEGRNEFRGEITKVTVGEVEIKEKIGIFTIPICAIKKAYLDFEL